MTIKDGAFRRQAAKLTAILLVLGVYAFARLPEPSEAELAKLAEDFHFRIAPLPALNDLDGDGLPNDTCYVDTRIDKVIVAPVPGTPARYQPFTLDPINLPYDK